MWRSDFVKFKNCDGHPVFVARNAIATLAISTEDDVPHIDIRTKQGISMVNYYPAVDGKESPAFTAAVAAITEQLMDGESNAT